MLNNRLHIPQHFRGRHAENPDPLPDQPDIPFRILLGPVATIMRFSVDFGPWSMVLTPPPLAEPAVPLPIPGGGFLSDSFQQPAQRVPARLGHRADHELFRGVRAALAIDPQALLDRELARPGAKLP